MKFLIRFFALSSISYVPLLLLALTAAFNTAAQAQTAGVETTVNEAMVQSKIAALNANQQMDAALKTKLLEIYQAAHLHLQAQENYRALAKTYEQALKLAPAQLKSLNKTIAKLSASSKSAKPETFEGIDTEELEQRLIIERTKLSDLNNQIKKTENDLNIQNARLPQIRQDIADLQEKIDATADRLQAFQPDESKLESEAHYIQLQSKQTAQMAELRMLEMEALSNPQRVALLKAQDELLSLQNNALTPTINVLEEVLAERRQQEAEKVQQALSKAEKELAGKPVVIQAVTRKNIQLGRDLSDITDKITDIGNEQEKIDAVNRQIAKDFKSAEQKISLAGLSPALGKILREQRRDLPNTRLLEAQSQEMQNDTAQISIAQLRAEDSLKELTNINQSLKSLMQEQVDASLPAEERLQIQAELRMLLNNQVDLLNKLLTSYSTYLRLIGDAEFARQQTLNLAEKYASYLDKHLLWVPSSPTLDRMFFVDVFHALQWLLMPKHWQLTAQEFNRELRSNPWLTIFSLASLAVLFALKRYALRQLPEISKKVSKPYSDKLSYTLQALGYSLLLVAPLPLAFYCSGWLLKHDLNVSEFSHAVGEGLCKAAVPLFTLQFFYVLTHPKGIAELHMRWRENSRKLMRTIIAWLRFIVVPARFITAMTGAQHNAAYNDGLGRLTLIVLLLAISLALGKLLKFKGGIAESLFRNYPQSWITRLRYLWYPIIVATPLIISGFAIAGYYVSALELEHKMVISIRLAFMAVVLHDLSVRWLSLINRKLAIIKAKQKREAELAAKTSPEPPEDLQLVSTADAIDIPTINAQTRQMLYALIAFGLTVSLWAVWADILPALSILNDIVLWQHTTVADGVETQQPVTMVNLLLAGLYVFIVTIALRNLPGMLEVLLLKQLAVQPGNRYAVNQLAHYVLISFGTLAVFVELGGSWQQIQWLVAALGVGLGFGLQEIFANLVSGIILLFERPIRVGDTVTVGDVSGKVCRIQIRATTILDWDQKELIVPNKTFITNQLVNWSLSDQVTRLVIEVGIAYGSDTALAHQVLSDTVRATPLVLKDPEPSVLFLGFGDSSLNFSIRVYVNELANRLPLTHELHMRIERALREHGIEIPFPQRDLHLRSIEPGIMVPGGSQA
ncbi:MAG: mechanosensitive ion channel domain-containing protein [Gammaproteobacteria bacterium]